MLEALAYTNVNLLLDVKFNREVAQDSAFYWHKDVGNLASVIDHADKLTQEEIRRSGERARKRISDIYNWDGIISAYEDIFEKQE